MTDDAAQFPWTLGGVAFTEAVMAAIDADAQRGLAADEECCGLVTGPASDPLAADAILVFENRANKLHAVDPETFTRTGREYCDMHPLKFARALDEGPKNGAPVKVLYHSHIDCGAYFSPTDAAAATGIPANRCIRSHTWWLAFGPAGSSTIGSSLYGTRPRARSWRLHSPSRADDHRRSTHAGCTNEGARLSRRRTRASGMMGT